MTLPVYFTQYHPECGVYCIIDRIQGKPLDGYYFVSKEEAEQNAKSLEAMLREQPTRPEVLVRSLPPLPVTNRTDA